MANRSLRRGQLVVPVAACSLLACPSIADAARPLIVRGGSPVTLERILGGGFSLASKRGVEAGSFDLAFPPGASQGPESWYLIRLDLAVAFEADSKPGSVLVSGFTRGQAGAQVEFHAGRDKRGRAVVRWDTVDLIRGQWGGRATGNEARLRYTNYLPFKAVRAGTTKLTLQVERLGGAKVSDVRFGPASGVYATSAGPVELTVAADFPDEEVLPVGQASELEVVVSNASTRLAHGVAVSVQPQSDHLFVDGPAQRTIERLDRSSRTSFRIGRTRPGKLRVRVVATAPNGNEALVAIESDVARKSEGNSKRWIALLLAATSIAGAALLRRRMRGEVGR